MTRFVVNVTVHKGTGQRPGDPVTWNINVSAHRSFKAPNDYRTDHVQLFLEDAIRNAIWKAVDKVDGVDAD